MNLIITIVAFLLILSFLVIIHEIGHLVAAKLFGVGVSEFGVGYPPLMKKLFNRWGVDFTLNWFPFGGFVKLAGEEREDVISGDKSMFYSKPTWQRLIIILAGAFINFIFGILAFSIMFTALGIPYERGVAVGAVAEKSPAFVGGVVANDRILAGTDSRGEKTFKSVTDFLEFAGKHKGETVVFKLKRADEVVNASVYIRKPEEVPAGEGAMGISVGSAEFGFERFPLWQMPFRGAWAGLQTALEFGRMILMGLKDMVSQLIFRGMLPKDVAGPVGIVYSAQKENLLHEGWLAILNFAAVLSINLAIVNVLPIPALDGGRALFILLEKVLGKWLK